MKNNSVDLPENYVALVLPTASQAPPQKDLDQLRLKTIEYLQPIVKAQFPSLQKIDLQFTSTEFGSDKPSAKFNLYLKTKATAHFDGRARVPEANDVFQYYISSFTKEYLDKIIRKLGASSSLSETIEVRARLLGKGTPGGAVVAPPFYLAFVCEDGDPKIKKADIETMQEKCHTEFTRILKEEFDDFTSVQLKVVKTAAGEKAGKPEARFNLYVEMEAVGKFKQNVPEHMDFFQAISEPRKAFPTTLKKVGGCFASSTDMVIRCVHVETPDLPEGPGDEDDEGGEPDEGEGEGGEKEKEKLKVKVELGFYVALVVRELEKMPASHHLASFDDLMQQFFSKALAEAFEDKFVDLKLTPSPQYEAGIPLPRFNLLHQYEATGTFYHKPPDGTEVLKKILYCDLTALYNTISGHSAPYNNVVEFTLGPALEKQATDQAYGGKLSDEQQKKLAEEKAAKEAAEKAAAEKKRQEAQAARNAAERKRQEELAAKRAAEEKKKQEEARKRKEAKAFAEKRKREAEAAARKAAEEKRKTEEARKAEEERKRKKAAVKALAEKKKKES